MVKIEDEPWYARKNAVPMQPWVWATMPCCSEPVEVVSYPWFENDIWNVNVRRKVGDPTTITTVDAQFVSCFDKTSHELFYEEKVQMGDQPDAYLFVKDIEAAKSTSSRVAVGELVVEGHNQFARVLQNRANMQFELKHFNEAGAFDLAVEWAKDH